MGFLRIGWVYSLKSKEKKEMYVYKSMKSPLCLNDRELW